MAALRTYMMLDPSYPRDSTQIVLNLDHLVWAAPDPRDAARTLVKLSGDASVVLLVPYEDVVEHLRDTGQVPS